MRGNCGDDDIHVPQRCLEVGGDPQRVGKLDARKVDIVGPARRQFPGQRRVACPETGIVTGAGQMDGQRGPPPSRAYDSNLTNMPSYAR